MLARYRVSKLASYRVKSLLDCNLTKLDLNNDFKE